MPERSSPEPRIRVSTNRPTGLSTSHVKHRARFAKHEAKARATLYSAPPSHTWKERACSIRVSPGSKRNSTSPMEMISHTQLRSACPCITLSKARRAGNDNQRMEPLPDEHFGPQLQKADSACINTAALDTSGGGMRTDLISIVLAGAARPSHL